MALKTEALGLAVAVELPLVICNIQRGGPSTGLPTKTEQADLLQALYGRNSEAPIPVLAPSTPGDCFWIALEASRIAIKYMVPVIILSDGYLANGAEPWRIPDVSRIAGNSRALRDESRRISSLTGAIPQTLARPWAIPGTPGLEHRVGGIEKQDVTGNVNYEPLNHEHMVRTARRKSRRHRARYSGRRSRRRSVGRFADRRLGLNARPDHRGDESPARQGPSHRPCSPALPEPAAEAISAMC